MARKGRKRRAVVLRVVLRVVWCCAWCGAARDVVLRRNGAPWCCAWCAWCGAARARKRRDAATPRRGVVLRVVLRVAA